jgi:hypothetical protein
MSDNQDERPSERVCFYICPIGALDSPERKRSNQIFKYIINPVATECGFTHVTRADKEEHSGMIGPRIISRLAESELVIAD